MAAPRIRKILAGTGVLGTMLGCLAGCAVGPDFVRPAPPPVDGYTQGPEPTATIAAQGRPQRFHLGGQLVPEWWRLFGSPTLDAAVAEAIANNQSLQAAQASLRQSQYALRAGYGVFFPQLDAAFDATRQKFSPARLGSTSSSSIFNLFTLSATVNYALDLFGGERRAVEGLQAQVDAQRALALGTYLTLAGNVANTLIARAGYTEQIAATEQIIAFLQEQIAIIDAQVQAGIVPYVNLLSLRTQRSSFEAQLALLKQRRAQTEHLLATLIGRTPAQWNPSPLLLAELTLPVDLPLTLPSELVRRRPDILAAEAQLHGASAQIGVATAALFPSLTLSGSYGQNNTSLDRLFSSDSDFWSFGAGVTAPLFHGGTLWFRRKAAMEGYQQALAIYRQTVLSAFAQVADTLRALEHDAEANDAQSQALATASEALQLTEANYQAGIVNYLQILIASEQYHRARIGYIEAQAQRLQDTVALFVALGGAVAE